MRMDEIPQLKGDGLNNSGLPNARRDLNKDQS